MKDIKEDSLFLGIFIITLINGIIFAFVLKNIFASYLALIGLVGGFFVSQFYYILRKSGEVRR